MSSVWKLQYVEERFRRELKWMSQHMNGVNREMFQNIFVDKTGIDLTDYWQVQDGSLDDFITYFTQYWDLKWGYVRGLEKMDHLHYKLIDNVDKIYFNSRWECKDELTSQRALIHFFGPTVQRSIFDNQGHVISGKFDGNLCYFSGVYDSLLNGVLNIKKTLNKSLFKGVNKIIFAYTSTLDTFGIIKFDKNKYWTAQVVCKKPFNKEEIYKQYWTANYDKYRHAIDNACIKTNHCNIGAILTIIRDYTYDEEDFFCVQPLKVQQSFLEKYFQDERCILQSLKLFMYTLNKTAKFQI